MIICNAVYLVLCYNASHILYMLHIPCISGCSKGQQRVLTKLYRKLFPYYYIHFTPDYKLTDFHYSNKPNGNLFVIYIYYILVLYTACAIYYAYYI